MNGARTRFRIFEPDSPPMTADETQQIRNSGLYRTMMLENLNDRQNGQSGENPESHVLPERTQSQQQSPTDQSGRLPFSRNELLLDLHQQQLDAIHKATELIANSLRFAPDDHT